MFNKIKFGYVRLGSKVTLPNGSVVTKTDDRGWYMGICNAVDSDNRHCHVDNNQLVEISLDIEDNFSWGDQEDV